jgi:hypothetical protein
VVAASRPTYGGELALVSGRYFIWEDEPSPSLRVVNAETGEVLHEGIIDWRDARKRYGRWEVVIFGGSAAEG